jgi:hypothetical protein
MPGEMEAVSAFEKQQKQLENVIGEKLVTKTEVDEKYRKKLDGLAKTIEKFSSNLTQEEKKVLYEEVKDCLGKNNEKLRYDLGVLKDETRREYIETQSLVLNQLDLLKNTVNQNSINALKETDTNEEAERRTISDNEFAKIIENISRGEYIEVIEQETLRDENFEKKGKAKAGDIFQILDEQVYYKTWGKKQYEYRKVVDTNGNEFFICTSDGNAEIKRYKVEYIQVHEKSFLFKKEGKKMIWGGIAHPGVFQLIDENPLELRRKKYRKVLHQKSGKELFIRVGTDKTEHKSLEKHNENNLSTKLDLFTLANKDAKKNCMRYALDISESILENTEVKKKYSAYIKLSRRSDLRKTPPFYIKNEASFQGFMTLDYWMKEYNKDTKKELKLNDLEHSSTNKERIDKFLNWFKKTDSLKKAGNIISIHNRRHIEPFRAYESRMDPNSEKFEKSISKTYEKIINAIRDSSNTPMLLSLERIFQKKGKTKPGSHGGFLVEENGEYFLYHSSTDHSSRKSSLKNYLNTYFQKNKEYVKNVYLSLMLMDSKGNVLNLNK